MSNGAWRAASPSSVMASARRSEKLPAMANPPKPASPFSVDDANDSSGFLLWQVTALWQRRVAEALRPHELTQVQYALLASLLWLSRTEDDVTQSRLAAHAK